MELRVLEVYQVVIFVKDKGKEVGVGQVEFLDSGVDFIVLVSLIESFKSNNCL